MAGGQKCHLLIRWPISGGKSTGHPYGEKKKNADRAEMAFDRALELIDLTLKYGRQHEPGRNAMLKELCRLREIFCAEYLSENPDALESSDKFFMPFGMAAARRRQKTGAATE